MKNRNHGQIINGNFTQTRTQNSKFFNHYAKAMLHQQSLKCLYVSPMEITYSCHKIQVEFHHHFDRLWTIHDFSSSKVKAAQIILSKVNLIQEEYYENPIDALSRSITKEEIYKIMMKLPKGKSPSLDGMPIEFHLAIDSNEVP